jgi:enamine deaminase RidA (YjgF/YER057c/UK114 family)
MPRKKEKPIDTYVSEEAARTLADFDVITMQDIVKSKSLHDEISGIIQRYLIDSNQFMNGKKALWADYEKQLLKPKAHKDSVIKFHMLHQHMKAHVSNYYDSDLTVSFPGFEYWYDDQ